MTQFSELGLAQPILRALSASQYKEPTPIQAQAIPHVLAGRDLLGLAATGTGKTAAFALPILHRFAANPKRMPRGRVRALVLSPTRELSAQIADSFRVYGKGLGLRVAVIVGGSGYGAQTEALNKGLDVLVATPGRLLDHIARGTAKLDVVETLVLDEADHMLDLGFIPAIRQLLRHLPKQRQNLFFSATMPKQIGQLADDMLRDPVRVAVTPSATPAERIDQQVIHVEPREKTALLATILRDRDASRVLVFTRTKHGADKVVKGLSAARIGAIAIHGNKSQGQRTRALDGFRTGHTPVLVATDIAARGIDVDDVALVVNYDLPHVPETYVHRIGRTARAGASGSALSFCGSAERPLLRDIEKLIRCSIPVQGAAAPDNQGLQADRRHPRPPKEKRNRNRKPARRPRQGNGFHARPATAAHTATRETKGTPGHGGNLAALPFMRGATAGEAGASGEKRDPLPVRFGTGAR